MEGLPTQEDFDKFYTPNGKFAFRCMFKEFFNDNHTPIFTLRPRAFEGVVSAYQIYMESVDEYDAASKLAPNMRIWDIMCNATWFMEGDPKIFFEGLVVWREHMAKRDASLARKVLLEKTEGGNATAAKAILAESKSKMRTGKKPRKVQKTQNEDARILEFKKKQEARG